MNSIPSILAIKLTNRHLYVLTIGNSFADNSSR